MFKRPSAAGLTLAAPILFVLSAAPTARAAHPLGHFQVTNDAHRVVECTLLVGGHTWAYLKVHMGKTYGGDFTQGRLLQLACIRGTDDIFGPLKPGVDYRFVDAPNNRIKVVAAGAPSL
ncbi:MAG TPA: hypothetical protein VFE18_06420 [Phenylobacterium sp.]|jgi:hypothetical protein|uniref:hypothetical protein n=1 Tax=Phenylobacterium sp. TaxID=1871053 RepID=UPI002D4E7FC8|nr:hypothetical protein [Phenylobacterium sp.]HZZ67788.1 hypothetical protein [Phenylobacterium sp.]